MNPLLLAVLPLVGAAVGAALQFLFGRSLEGRKQLMLQRAQAYIDFGRGLAADPSVDNQRLLADAKLRIHIYGSTDVVQKLAKLYVDGPSFESARGRAALFSLLRAMRADLSLRQAKVSDEDMSRVLFFGRPSPKE